MEQIDRRNTIDPNGWVLELKSVDLETSLAVVVGSGECTIDHFVSVWLKLLAHPSWPQINKILYDLSEAAALIETEHIVEMVKRDKENAERLAGKRLALVTGVPVTYGMARMLETLGQPTRTYQMGIFHTEAEARAWLEATG